MRFKTGAIVVVLFLVLTVGSSVAFGALDLDSPVEPPALDAGQFDLQKVERHTTPELIDLAFGRGDIDEQERLLYLAYAIGDTDQLPIEFRGSEPWSGTQVILELERALSSAPSLLTRRSADTINAVLAGSCSSSTGGLTNVRNSEHFHIEYGDIGGGLTVDDYESALEATWQQEVESFGWAAPPVLASNPPPGNRYHVRIVQFADTSLLGYVSIGGTHAGYVGDNPNTAWDEGDSFASCMALSSDFSKFNFPPDKTMDAMDATAAHEFVHSIQNGYGVLTGSNQPDQIFVEGGANWMIDEVFADSDIEHRNIWPEFEKCMGEYRGNAYWYWITFRGLTEQFGVGVPGGGEQIMQDFWELTSQSADSNMLGALNTALVNKGTSLPAAFHQYAITLRFNKPCPTAAPLCFKEADGYVNSAGKIGNNGTIEAVGNSYSSVLQDNYAINYVGLPNTGFYAAQFENESSGGEFQVSIVADLGDDLHITPFPSVIKGNSGAQLPIYVVPEGARKVVAIITNQQQTSNNPSSCAANPYSLRLLTSEASQGYLLPVIIGE